MHRTPSNKPDIRERGAPRNGQPQTSERRLFMQFLAFGNCRETGSLADALAEASIQGVLYENINDPYGVAVLTISDDPDFFVTDLRRLLQDEPFRCLSPQCEYTMMGRTYSIGYEPDLDEVLRDRPRRTALNPQWPWAIWYPLRRSGAFAELPEWQQRTMLMEHGAIGRAFGEADYAHDIRLACHGLDKHDNDFVIGLTGRELHPLSAIVATMRKTRQTSRYLLSLGPFFVGKAAWQSKFEGTEAPASADRLRQEGAK